LKLLVAATKGLLHSHHASGKDARKKN